MISIVMTYFNRKQQLLMTLKSIALYASDIEVIIVDDASRERVEDVVKQFSYPIKLIRIEPQEKWWVNPCMAFNRGFKEAKGDKVIIQNAECVHAGNVIRHVRDNLTDSTYLSYGCYSVAQQTYRKMMRISDVSRSISSILPLKNVTRAGQLDGWYNHTLYRPFAYHFTSAITQKKLTQLGGFDERYASGLGYDDNDFLWRVKHLPLEVSIVDNPYTIHLFHNSGSVVIPGSQFQKNREIYHSRMRGEI